VKQVFISHVAEDSDIAVPIAEGLEQRDISTWYFERDTRGGIDLLLQVSEAVDQSQLVVVVLSKSTFADDYWLEMEIARAVRSRKGLVSVLRDITPDELDEEQSEWCMAFGQPRYISVASGGVNAGDGRRTRSVRRWQSGHRQWSRTPQRTTSPSLARPEPTGSGATRAGIRTDLESLGREL
jgi:hypothetical protein